MEPRLCARRLSEPGSPTTVPEMPGGDHTVAPERFEGAPSGLARRCGAAASVPASRTWSKSSSRRSSRADTDQEPGGGSPRLHLGKLLKCVPGVPVGRPSPPRREAAGPGWQERAHGRAAAGEPLGARGASHLRGGDCPTQPRPASTRALCQAAGVCEQGG